MSAPSVQIIEAGILVSGQADIAPRYNQAITITAGRISQIEPIAPERRADATYIDARNCIVLPGLINSHTHLGMSLMRGIANDLPLMTWLQDHVWPIEGRFVDPQFVRASLELAFAESLRAGVTCFNDMYFFPEVLADVAEEIGVRASIGLPMFDFPTAYGDGPDDYFNKAHALNERLNEHPLLRTAWAPHAPYTVSAPNLQKIKRCAERDGTKIHIHVHETTDEIDNHQKIHRCRPLAHLEQLGLLDEQLIAVHMVHLNEEEITRVGQRGVNVVHCPESNLKLASGVAPISALEQAGANIAIGTDGVASNNDHNLLGELQTASYLAKGTTANAACLPAPQMLQMGTLNGAQALGYRDLGTLRVGASADLTAIAIDNPESQPLYDPQAHLIYSACRQHVRHVWVAGRQLLADRMLTSIDLDACLDKIRYYSEQLGAHK